MIGGWAGVTLADRRNSLVIALLGLTLGALYFVAIDLQPGISARLPRTLGSDGPRGGTGRAIWTPTTSSPRA
jgi:hypothetical protein